MAARLTERQVDELLAEDKVITANILWRREGKRRFKIDATVMATRSNTIMRLYGTIGLTKRSFALLLNSIDIRRICLSDISKHKNKDGTVMRGIHKHAFEEETLESGDAYIPTDITGKDVNTQFADFLRECKITLQGDYQPWLL